MTELLTGGKADGLQTEYNSDFKRIKSCYSGGIPEALKNSCIWRPLKCRLIRSRQSSMKDILYPKCVFHVTQNVSFRFKIANAKTLRISNEHRIRFR